MELKNKPVTLFNQCIKYVVQNLNCLATTDPKTNEYCLKDGISLPSVICDKIIHVYQELGYNVDDSFLNIFNNPDVTNLKRVKFKRFDMSNEKFCMLLNHDIQELEIGDCSKLTSKSWMCLNEKGDKFTSLSLRQCNKISVQSSRKSSNKIRKLSCDLNIPNVRKLVITQLQVPEDKNYFPSLITPLKKITHLDLSECSNLGSLSYLMELPNLTYLILYNVKGISDIVTLSSIEQLKGLRHLDVSQHKTDNGYFENPDVVLENLVKNLPNLVSLDISGTNLDGLGDGTTGDIPGLRRRAENPLEFLGLYGTLHNSCTRSKIAAKRIAGSGNEEQILNAGAAYVNRPEVLKYILTDIISLLQMGKITKVNEVLMVSIDAMYRYLDDKLMRSLGCAVIYHITKSVVLKDEMSQNIIRIILDAIDEFWNNKTFVKNCCNILRQLYTPRAAAFEYGRMVEILLKIVADEQRNTSITLLKHAMQILNDMSSGVDIAHKEFMGSAGVIDKMLRIVESRLKREDCDQILDLTWSILWNITDETPINSRRFLNKGGLKLLLKSTSIFQDDGLFHYVMGLMGNVAEVQDLRPRLMNTEFISVVFNLLNSKRYGFEVSYSAAGILAHLCSDGLAAWTVAEPERNTVLKHIMCEIGKWKILKKSTNYMNYRSFRPLFDLLKTDHTPECQYFAVWALADLTNASDEVNVTERNCSLLEKDGGIKILIRILQSETVLIRTKELALMSLTNWQQYCKSKRTE